MSGGAKIIEGLKDAVVGNFSSVYIEGQHWVRADWQPIETAPRDRTPILVVWWTGNKAWQSVAWMVRDETEEWWTPTDASFRHYLHPTHWMPLPSPPVQER